LTKYTRENIDFYSRSPSDLNFFTGFCGMNLNKKFNKLK